MRLKLLFFFCGLFLSIGSFAQCGPGTPSFDVDLTGDPSGIWTSLDTTRNDICCGDGNCIKFVITLDSAASGIRFDIISGAVPGGVLYYQVDCGPQKRIDSAVCLAGAGPHTLTFCKPGLSPNVYQITSIPMATAGADDTVGLDCTAHPHAAGFDSTTVIWNSIFPGAVGDYNSYLSCASGCQNPIVTTSGVPPPYVDYEVCGILDAQCTLLTVCDTVRVTLRLTLPDTIVPAICSATTFTFNATSTLPAPTFSWDRATVSGIAEAGISGAGDVNEPLTNTTSDPIDVTYVYITTSGTCIGNPQNVIVTVNPDAAIALTSAAGTDTQSLCINIPITNITYTVTGGGTGAGATGLPAGVTGAFSGGVFTVSGTPSVTGTTIYTVTTTGTCVQTIATGTITVNPDAAITLTSVVGSDSQSVCVNTAITDITYTVTGGGTGATVSALPAGVSGAFVAGIFTISGTPSVAGTTIYTVTTTGTCVQTIATGSITVNPNASINLSSAVGTDSQSVCLNTAITDIEYTSNNVVTNVTATGLPAGVTTNFNAGTGVFTISGTPSVSGVYAYTLTTTGSCVQTDTTGSIRVGISLSSAAGTNIQSVCKNSAITTITYALGGSGASAIASGLPPGVSGSLTIPGMFTISGTPSVEGTYTYTVTTTAPCAATSLTGIITVGLGLPDDTTNIQSVCKNAAIIDIDYDVVGGGTPTTTGLPQGLTTNFNAGTNVFTISGTPSVEGTYNYTVTTTGSCTDQSSLTGTITVGLGLPADTTNIQNVCKNTAILDIDYDVVGGGAPLTTGLPAGLSTNFNTGSNVFTISGTPSVEGTYDYTVTTTGSCADQSSLTGTITVGLGLPDDTTNIQNVCKNTAINDIDYDVVGGAAPTTTGLPAGLTTNFNAGTNVFTISGTPSVEGTYDYTVTTTGSCTDQSSLTGTITVGLGLPDDTTNIQSMCKNTLITDIDYDVVGGGTPITTGLPAGLSTNFNAGSNVFTISGTPSVEGTYDYTVTTTGSCADQSSLTGTITVGLGLPDDTTNIQSVCKNTAILDIDYDVVGGGTPTVTGLPQGLTTNFNAGTNVFTISGTPSVEGTYNYTVTTTGSCTDQSSLTGTITVGLGLPDDTTNVQSVCKNTAINDIDYDVVGGAAPLTTGLPAGLTTNFNAGTNVFTISGTPSVEGTYNYTVTTTGSCTDQSSLTGTITVGLGLPDDTTNIQSVCKNTAIADINYDVVGGGAPLTTGLPAGLSTNFNAGSNVFTISGTPSMEGTYNYTVTTTGSCADQSSLTGTITVGLGLPDDTANVQSVCKNTAIVDINYDVVGGGTPLTTGLPAGLNTNFNTGSNVFTISGTPSVEGTYDYTVTTTGSCADQSSLTGTITVGLGLPDDTTNIQSVCKNTAILDIDYDVVGGAAPSSTGLPAGLTTNFNAGSNVFTISGTPSVEGTYKYTVTTTGSCTDQSSLTGTITVGLGLPDDTANVQSVCKNTAIVDINYDVVGGGTPTTSGLPAGLTTNFNAGTNVFTISGTPSIEGTYDYTVTTTGSCTDQSSLTGTITVGMSSPLANNNIQNVCKNIAIADITYNFVGGGTPTVSSLPPGVTGSVTNPGEFSISGTASVEGIFNYTVTTVGSCTTESSFTGTITVGGGLDPTGGGNVQEICKSSAIIPIKYKIVGTSATITGLPGGITGTMTTPGSPGVFTISGTPSVAGVFDYTVTTVGACLVESSFTGTLTVNEATATLSIAGTDAQTFCSNNTITDIVYTIGGTGTSATVSALPSGLGSSFNNGVFTISGTPNLAEGVYTYTVTPTGGICPPSLEIFTITIINPIAEFTTDSELGSPPLLVNCSNTSQNANTYTWSFGDGTNSSAFDTSYTYLAKGVYTVQLIASNNSQCPDTATTTITVYKIVIPNVFTPNGDNVNDVFKIEATGIQTLDVEIYNRWGTKIYEWHVPGGYWDGKNTLSGLPSENSTYYYIVKATDIEKGEYIETGFVTLIR